MKTRDDSQGGQAIIEFALVLPILLLILGGIIELGILFYNKQVLTNASREGARAGIAYVLNTTGNKIPPKSIQETVRVYCTNRLITFGELVQPIVDPVETPESLKYPDDLIVSVSYPYEMMLSKLLNLFGADMGPTINLQAKTVMQME